MAESVFFIDLYMLEEQFCVQIEGYEWIKNLGVCMDIGIVLISSSILEILFLLWKAKVGVACAP